MRGRASWQLSGPRPVAILDFRALAASRSEVLEEFQVSGEVGAAAHFVEERRDGGSRPAQEAETLPGLLP